MDRSSSDPAIPPEVLVAHAGFVRRIAFALLRDDADADDAAQETLVRGLSAGPREPRARRAWLATVVRNVAGMLRRGEGRRHARERAVSRVEGGGSTLDAAARQETLAAVVAAIGALDGPAREVVLLRHYDELPPREIARRLGVPVETVKKRLVRAHAALRERLVGEGTRERERRRRALAGFAGIEGLAWGGAVATGGAMAWSAKTTVVAALGLLALGAGVWVWVGRGGHDDPASGSPAPLETAVVSEPGGPALAARDAAPAAAPPTPVPADRPAVPREWIAYGPGRASFRAPREWTDRSHDGPRVPNPPELFRLTASVEGGGSLTWSSVLRKDADALVTSLADATATPVVLGGRAATEHRGRTTIGGVETSVRVLRLAALDGFDEPIAFVFTVPASAPASVLETIDLVRGTLALTPFPPAVAAAMGDVPGDVIEVAVFLEGVPAAGTVSLTEWVPGDGVGTLEDDGSWHVEKKVGSEIEFSGTARFDGLDGAARGGTTHELLVRGALIGAHRVTVNVSGDPSKPHPRLVLTLGPGVVRGRAFARDGKPAAHATVVVHVGNGAYGALIATGEATTDAEGNYEVRGLPRGYAMLKLALPPLDGMPQAAREGNVVVRDATPATLDFGDARVLPTWRGRVVDSGGRPIPGPGTLRLLRQPGNTPAEGAIVARDARFEARVEPGRYRVTGMVVRTSEAPRYIDAVDVEVLGAGLERDLVVGGGTIVLRVLRANGQSAGEGVEVWLERDGPVRTTSYGGTTDKEGRVQFRGMPAARYRVFERHGFGGGSPPATLAEVDVADPPVPIEREVRLSAPEGR